MQMSVIQNIKRYYKVGRFLHVVAIGALGITIYSAIHLSLVTFVENPATYQLWLGMLIVFGCMTFLAELDGFSRYQNYKQLKDQLFLNGYQERLLKPMLRSSCQRDAALISCDELGLGSKVREYFNGKGYRWYHIIPDFVFQYPLFFFSAFFWRTTFFTPYYKSKIDYSQLDLSEIDLSVKGLRLEKVTQ